MFYECYLLPVFAGLEHGSRVSKIALNCSCERVRATEHATRNPYRVLERRNCFAEIVEGGAVVFVEHRRVNQPYPDRVFMRRSEGALRQGHRLAQQCLGLFIAKLVS
jgi:hypothetical protein